MRAIFCANCAGVMPPAWAIWARMWGGVEWYISTMFIMSDGCMSSMLLKGEEGKASRGGGPRYLRRAGICDVRTELAARKRQRQRKQERRAKRVAKEELFITLGHGPVNVRSQRFVAPLLTPSQPWCKSTACSAPSRKGFLAHSLACASCGCGCKSYAAPLSIT